MISAASDHCALEPRKLEQASDAQSRIGQVVAGTYCIVRHLGSGGSSHVYEAEHLRLAKSFALKVLRPELRIDDKTAQRFRREARAMGRVRSEHVVSVVDFGELDDQTPYLVMELLQGEDLRSLLRRECQLPLRRALHIALDACRGLVAVHEAGLVHRDLKPENLFITRHFTGEEWCKVLDFGVVKMDASPSTAQGAIIGTVRYMAPEQLADGAAVGPVADVYAMGAILHECLAGSPLVEGASVQEVMYQVINVEARPLRVVRPELPLAVSQLIERCVTKAASKRPTSSAELEQAIQGLLTPESCAPTERTLSESSHTSTRAPPIRRLRIPGLALAPAALLLAGVTGWLLRGPTTAARTVALHGSGEPRLELDHGQEAVEARGAQSWTPRLADAWSVTPPPVLPSTAPATPLASSTDTRPMARLAAPKRHQTELKPMAASSATVAARPALRHFDASNPYE
ncbi:MAG TPA: serine/threonine-protein kinase [Polyangiaceae bacterium]|nr:serine/threonine-protein kinase [Polyangiaceae bacterium]